MLSLDKVFNAQTVLKSIIRETNMVRAYGIAPDCELYLKPENLQITGSFKVRGSAYKIAMLSDEEKAKGVIACSAGNHAQGVALAATKNGIKSLICLPDSAPISKVEATKGFGADVCLVEGCYDDAYQKALELKDSEGYTFVHPFDDENVIAGQGTIALEILSELDDIDAVVVPIGGGGLISGIAYTVKQIRPSVKVYGVQVAGAPSMYNSVKDKEIECLPSVSTIADGIAVKQPGENTYSIVQKYVDEIVLVSDDEVASAILALIEKQKMVIEKLKEYKLSVITEAVTKGICTDVELKDSNIEWINKIPTHWDSVKLKYCTYIRARLGWKGLKAEEYVEFGYPLLSAFNIVNSKLDFDNKSNVSSGEATLEGAIYGIYDLSGGLWEWTAGYIIGFSIVLRCTIPSVSDVLNKVNFIGGNAAMGVLFSCIFLICSILGCISCFLGQSKEEL